MATGERVHVAGEDVDLLASRAAYWRGRSTLLVSDLHLGKVETFGAHGVGLPEALAAQPLESLAGAVRATGAERVLVLGDLLHAGLGITPALVERVRAWIAISGVRVAVVPGNHDRAIERVREAWRLEVLGRVHTEGVFSFAHDPADCRADGSAGGVGAWWCGHVHPVVGVRSAADSLRLACFWMRASGECVLPAFNVFTGGARIAPLAGDRVYAIADGRVVDLGDGGTRDGAERARARRIRSDRKSVV